MVASPGHALPNFNLSAQTGGHARAMPAQPIRADEARGLSRTKAVALALMLGLIAPSHITLPFESPKVTVMRGVLILLFFPALLTLLRSIGAGRQRVRLSDGLIVLSCIWMLFAFTVTEGAAVAAVSGSLYVLEWLGGYLVARAFFTTQAEFEVFVRALGKAMIVIIAVAVVDSLSGRNLVSDTVAQLFGKPPFPVQFREGQLRALSTLDHAIMYGSLCAFAGVLVYYGQPTVRLSMSYLALCVFGCFLAKSSAPLLACGIGVAVIIYDKVMQAYPWRWKLFWIAVAVPTVALFLISNGPFYFLIRTFTLDPWTGYYRLNIWEYAGAEVLNSPWVGIGQRDWRHPDWMSGSIDTLWLALAVSFGIPGSALSGLVLLTAMRRSGPNVPERFIDPRLASATRGLSIILCLVIFVGFTVHFWNLMWTMLGILAGLRTTLEEARERDVKRLLQAQRQHVRRQHQFAPNTPAIRTGPPTASWRIRQGPYRTQDSSPTRSRL